MRRLTVLIDMDDTIVDLLPSWVNYLNSKHGTSVEPENVADWKIYLFFPTLHTWDVYDPLCTDEMWKSVKPKPGALEYLQRLKADGHELLLVTSGPCSSILPKMKWVFFEYLNWLFDWDDVIITSKKQKICGDVLIDDGIHNHNGAARYGILMDAPHNRNYDAETNGLVRAKTWEEIYKIVCEYARLED